jgi:hypothetical protein
MTPTVHSAAGTHRRVAVSAAGMTGVVVALTLGIAGCSGGPWRLSSEPKLRVDVATGCPTSLSGYQDVVNTYTGSKLVPGDPTGGLICRYYPTGGAPSPTRGQLARQTRLDSAEANELATAIRGLDLRPPTGTHNCPNSVGSMVIIGLSYASGPDVGLAYKASGCKTLDNGRLGSFEGGNPSFYDTFEGVIEKLS